MSKPQTFTTEFKVPHNFFWSSLLRGGDEAKACDHLNEWGEPYTDSPWMKGQKCPKCGVTL